MTNPHRGTGTDVRPPGRYDERAVAPGRVTLKGQLFLLLVAIFCAEVFVMLLLELLPAMPPHQEALIDSLLLIVVLVPGFYGLVYRPMHAQLHELLDAQQALEASERRFRDLADHVGEWIWEVDARGRFTYSSPALRDLLGYRPEELTGRYFFDLFLPEERDELRADLFAAFAAKRSLVDFVHRNVHRDGHVVTVETNGIPVLDDDGNLLGYRGSDRDISERIQTEHRLVAAKAAAETASRTKSAFLANMSHELRTPLNGTIGMLDLLDDSGLDPDQRERVMLARESARHLLRLIDQLLDFSRLEMQELVIHHEPFDPHRLVRDVADELRAQCQNKGLRLDVACHEMMPRTLVGDPSHIGVVLEHLVANAIKFTHQGHVRVEADFQAGREGRGALQLHVLDTGIGLPDGPVEHLFEEFTQAEDQPTRRFGGAGLGLALCRRLVEAMEGRIGAERRVGGGSLFWVSLPLESDAAAPPPGPDRATAAREP